MKTLFLLFFVLRVLSVFFISTFYVPDEYWQCLEVAHKLAFGYGHLTWEWTMGIRSYIYPTIIAGIYKTLQYFQLDTVQAIVYSPRIFQAFLSAIADVVFCKWYNKLQYRPKGFSYWATYAVATSWFWYYCASRSLANTLETVLTILGLYCYPHSFSKMNQSYIGFQWYIVFAGLATIIRPTALIHWSLLCCFHLYCVRNKYWLLFYNYLPLVVGLGVFSFIFDSYFYGRFVFVPWNFIKLNLYHNIGAFYGTQPFYWYLIIGFPVVMSINLVPFLIGSIKIFKNFGTEEYNFHRLLAANVIWTILIYSFIPHKEFRFLLPIFPMALFISVTVLVRWSRTAYLLSLYVVAGIMFFSCVIPGWYFGLVHNRGALDVMQPLAKYAHEHPTNTSILFLMPCHSTPLYSHLHVDVPAKFLTCEPNFSGKENYLDEAELFYKHPGSWLRNRYSTSNDLPTHVVCFDILHPSIEEFLNVGKYRLSEKIMHTQYPGSSRVGKFINLYVR